MKEVCVVQVANISLTSTREQFYTLFSHIGPIEEYVLYPTTEEKSAAFAARVGYIRYKQADCARMAVHLTNTMFLEKALIVAQVLSNKVPLEAEALQYCAPIDLNLTFIAGGVTWDSTIINKVVGQGNMAEIRTVWPLLEERGLLPFPELPGTLDYVKAEETSSSDHEALRENVPPDLSLENLCDFFSQLGEVRFMREASDSAVRCVYIEFSEISSIAIALCLNGFRLFGHELRVYHSDAPIIKSASLLTERDVKLLNWQQSPPTPVGRKIDSRRRSRTPSSSRRRRCSPPSHHYNRRSSPPPSYRPPPYRPNRYNRNNYAYRRSPPPRRRYRSSSRESRSPPPQRRNRYSPPPAAPRRYEDCHHRNVAAVVKRTRSPSTKSPEPRALKRSRRSPSPRRRDHIPKRINVSRESKRSPTTSDNNRKDHRHRRHSRKPERTKSSKKSKKDRSRKRKSPSSKKKHKHRSSKKSKKDKKKKRRETSSSSTADGSR